ncbi:hypothetical protein NMY22_g9775 [Coprinellus aureogranulatus]|nr:hypothetical protein NMY22_g9775 [Coprinellus aureogranulatus]
MADENDSLRGEIQELKVQRQELRLLIGFHEEDTERWKETARVATEAADRTKTESASVSHFLARSEDEVSRLEIELRTAREWAQKTAAGVQRISDELRDVEVEKEKLVEELERAKRERDTALGGIVLYREKCRSAQEDLQTKEEEILVLKTQLENAKKFSCTIRQVSSYQRFLAASEAEIGYIKGCMI